MDVVSHGLWGGAALGRKNRRSFFTAFGLSVLPDLLAEGLMFSLAFLGLEGMPDLSKGHPDISDFPAHTQNLYNATHSFVVFFAVFFVLWAARRRAFYPLAAWGLHIAIDIPTHSLALFPTPFLWPISGYRFDGTGWDSPVVMIPNVLMLAAVYGTWARRRTRKEGAAQVRG